MAFQVTFKDHLDTLMVQRLLFLKISFAVLTSAFPKNLTFYIKDFKWLVSLKLVASSLQ